MLTINIVVRLIISTTVIRIIMICSAASARDGRGDTSLDRARATSDVGN